MILENRRGKRNSLALTSIFIIKQLLDDLYDIIIFYFLFIISPGREGPIPPGLAEAICDIFEFTSLP